MANFELNKIKKEDYDKWDDFVDKSQEGTIFHKSYWLEASGSEFEIIGSYTGNQLRGGAVIPINENKFKQTVVTNPVLTPYTGILFQPKRGKRTTYLSNEKKIADGISKYLTNNYQNISLNLNFNYRDLQPFIWNGYSENVRYTYLLDCSDLDETWNGLDSSTRRSIKRAKKDNLYIKKEDNFKNIIKLVEKTFDRQDMTINHFKNTAYNYYNTLNNKKQCQPFICYDNKDRPIGGVYIVWDNKRSYYLLGGYDPEHGHHGASTLAMWEAIQYTSEELELKEFDFEGSMIQSVEKFFRKFGGKLTPYYQVKKGNFLFSLYYKLAKIKSKYF
ncbi:MAG: GNAT family N-acetyltransferase [archaeon]